MRAIYNRKSGALPWFWSFICVMSAWDAFDQEDRLRLCVALLTSVVSLVLAIRSFRIRRDENDPAVIRAVDTLEQ